MKLSIRPSFFILCLAMLVLKQSYLFVVYIFSVLIHESAHYFISIKRGYKCTCIVLSAFGAVLYGNFEQLSDDDEIKISLAGPISNLIIVVILIALWWVFPQSYIWTIDAVYANVSIGVINMLPAYPLDGGRILTAKLSKKMSRNRALNISILIARGVAILVFVLFIVSCFIKPNFTIGIFAIFLYSGNFSIVEQNVYKKLIFCDIEPKLNRGLEIKTIAISNKTKLYAINSKINTSCYLVLNIVDNGKIIGVLTQQQVADMMLNYDSCITIGECMQDNNLQNGKNTL